MFGYAPDIVHTIEWIDKYKSDLFNLLLVPNEMCCWSKLIFFIDSKHQQVWNTLTNVKMYNDSIDYLKMEHKMNEILIV